MNDSRIEVCKGGSVAFVGADAIGLFRAKALRSAIKLHKACGIIPTRGMTITRLLGEVTKLSGKPYKGKTKHDSAIQALDAHIAAMECALPIIAAPH